MLPKVGNSYSIQAYKHDGHLRRNWDQCFVVESDEEHLAVVTNKAWVRDDDGRLWYTREPAVCHFFADKWYNVIAMFRESGIYYYCNLASPVLFDGEAIKYIDYDLDYKFFPDGSWELLDEREYRLHSESMNYPPEIDAIMKKYMNVIVDTYKKGERPFNAAENEKLFETYLELLSK